MSFNSSEAAVVVDGGSGGGGEWLAATDLDIVQVDSVCSDITYVVRLWSVDSHDDVAAGQFCLKGTLPNHSATFCQLAFSPDGSQLAGGTGDGIVIIWNLATLSEIMRLYKNHNAYAVTHLEYNQGADRLLVCQDERLSMWDISTKQLAWSIETCAYVQIPSVVCIKFPACFAGIDHYIVTCGKSEDWDQNPDEAFTELVLWCSEFGDQAFVMHSVHKNNIECMTACPQDTNMVATGSLDCSGVKGQWACNQCEWYFDRVQWRLLRGHRTGRANRVSSPQSDKNRWCCSNIFTGLRNIFVIV
jgi:hypothetical protein